LDVGLHTGANKTVSGASCACLSSALLHCARVHLGSEELAEAADAAVLCRIHQGCDTVVVDCLHVGLHIAT